MDSKERSPLDSLFVNSQSYKTPQDKERRDRFIPNKVCANLYNLYFADGVQDKTKKVTCDTPKSETRDRAKDKYEEVLKMQLLGEQKENKENSKSKQKKRLINYTSETKSNNHEYCLSKEKDTSSNDKADQSLQRKIAKVPYKKLDAPGLMDDYYLNLMDWSNNNLIGIGLENFVYFWSAANSKVTKLCQYEDENVCSVSWANTGRHIAVGNTSGEVHMYDAQKMACVRVFDGHSGRVSSLDWNGNIIASGSRDRSILLRDVREPRDHFCCFTGPAQEICGVKWSFNENMLASGGNDNKLFLWSLKQQKEITRFHEHKAAVKAIGWSPHEHHILASGGGTADRCLRFWNTQTLEMVKEIDTGSQVCNLVFSKNSNELVSTHGFSLNQVIVWDYPTMEKLQTLTGHSMRVLYLAMNPTGQNIVTGAGDETLCFWNVFPPGKAKALEGLR